MSESNKLSGLEKVEKYYEDYGLRAKELKEQGQGVLAFLCAYVPVEIIHAAGFFPLRIKGSVDEPITKGNTQLESIAWNEIIYLLSVLFRNLWLSCYDH